jgi:hypothetical protein
LKVSLKPNKLIDPKPHEKNPNPINSHERKKRANLELSYEYGFFTSRV